MPTVAELSAPYTNFLLNPLEPRATGVCSVCLTFTDGYGTCYRCGQLSRFADAVLPISYSVAFGQLHTALAQYKRRQDHIARLLQMQLAAVLWRFLRDHEPCLARYANVGRFELVTTVPSGDPGRDAAHPLPRVVGELVGHTRDRHRRLLARSGTPVAERTVDPGKFNATRDPAGEAILLIDDTWTTGASAQSAAGALKTAGADRVAVLVIGRYVNPEWGANAERLRALPRVFDWGPSIGIARAGVNPPPAPRTARRPHRRLCPPLVAIITSRAWCWLQHERFAVLRRAAPLGREGGAKPATRQTPAARPMR